MSEPSMTHALLRPLLIGGPLLLALQRNRQDEVGFRARGDRLMYI